MYELFYWPSIQGRGEFIRLALEDAGAPYTDVARDPSRGVAELRRMMEGSPEANGFDGPAPFAPPFLKDGRVVLAQVANILQYLGPRLGLSPADETARLRANQLQLTLADLVAEIHDTHHPVGSHLYYDDQRPEALRRAKGFIAQRIPKFLGYFERALAGGTHLAGGAHSYVDLSLFQVIEGLRYAFPRAMADCAPAHPHVIAVRDRVAARPGVAAYLASPRRIAFNENGIFRRYPELDLTPDEARR